MVMVVTMVAGTCQVQYLQNIASRAEINPPASGASILHTCWYMSQDSTAGSVRRMHAREDVVPQGPLFDTRLFVCAKE